MKKPYEPIAWDEPGYADLHDELPLWSAPFGLALLDRVPLRAGDTILEIGPGTGYLAIELAQRCGPRTRVLAVDPWGEALRRLRWKLERMGIENVDVIEADMASAELEPGSVDVVVSNLGINNFDDPAAVLRAAHRAARDGAELLLATNTVGHMSEVYDAYRRVLLDLGQEHRLEALDRHVAHRGTVPSVSGLLEDVGFEVERVEERSFPMRFANASAMLRHRLLRLGFVPAWAEIPAPGRVEESLAALERELDRLAETRGELALTVPVTVFEARKTEPDG